MKKSVLSLLLLFVSVFAIGAETIECSIYWSGTQSSIVSPFGSSYSKGVCVRIDNNTSSPLTIVSVEIKLNGASLGFLNVDNPIIDSFHNNVMSFSLTNKYQMPSVLPSAVIKYEHNGNISETEVFNSTTITGIDNISTNTIVDGNYYDLSGKITKTFSKGKVYIHNGKKIVY